MKFLLILSNVFLGSSLTTLYYLLDGIDLIKVVLILISTSIFFFICLIFIIYYQASKSYLDTFFLSVMLSGVSLPVAYFLFISFADEGVLVAILGSVMIYVFTLMIGIRIVKGWYSYGVPYLDR
ncbi:MAG: hypothetical protein AAGI07_13140 [Bacteroidota bacterium]